MLLNIPVIEYDEHKTELNYAILTTLAPIFSRVLRFLVFLSKLGALLVIIASAWRLCLLEGRDGS